MSECGYFHERFKYTDTYLFHMQSFDEQLNRMCDWLVYHFNHKQDDKVSLIILTIEHFKNQNRPIKDSLFKVVDRRFVKTGDLELKIFFEDNYVED